MILNETTPYGNAEHWPDSDGIGVANDLTIFRETESLQIPRMRTHIFTITSLLLLGIVFADDSKQPQELTSLKESWGRARKQATDPIDKKYEDALLAMKQRFTKAGDLEAALAVDREIKSLAVQEPAVVTTSDEPAPKDFAGYTVRWGTTWSWELLPDQKFRKLEKGLEVAKGDYTIDPDGRVRLGSATSENFIPKGNRKGLFFKGGDDENPKGEVILERTKLAK